MSIDAMQAALEAMKHLHPAQRLAIKQAERQEPVVGPSASDWVHVGDGFYRKRGDTAPPQRQPLTEWRLVSESKPPEDVAVWLYEKDRGAWIGTFSHPDAEGWCFTRCYAMPYMSTEGGWDCVDAEWDDDYAPTHWMPLPAAPAHGIGGGE
jgi:hypothetical protein